MSDEAAKQKPAAPVHTDTERPGWLDNIIAPLMALLTFVGEAAILVGRSVATVVRNGIDVGDMTKQMAEIGVDSIWIVLVVTTATGAVFSFYTANLSKSFGFTGFVGGSLGYAFLNELGPVLGGVAFAARSGAAIAAEIGTMVVTEQVDALRAMAVSPIRYLVVPRVLAAVLMLPILIIFGDMAGVFGGYIFAGVSGVPHAEFIQSFYTYVASADLIHGLVKAVVFGFIVGLVACQQGLRTHGGATGVGRSTTSSVVLCVLLIFVSDFFLAQILTGQVVNP